MLKLSNDRKVSPLSRWKESAKRWEPVVPNSLGLSAGKAGSCPGETPFCKGCYAARTEKVFTSAGRLVAHNLETLQSTDMQGMVDLLADAVERFLAKAVKHGADPVFRIHWDGDLFSLDYARAWARVIRRFRGVQFWLYTRSFDMVEPFQGIGNVAVYLSVDEHNIKQAAATYLLNNWVHLAFCADTWEGTEELAEAFPVMVRKGPRCPELTGKLPMVGADGKGACVSCGLCVFGRNNVRFSKSPLS